MSILWPRLPNSTATELLSAFPPKHDVTHADAFFAESGGTRVDDKRVKKLRERIVDAAQKFGFPNAGGARNTDFDLLATRILFEEMGDNASDLYRPEVWNFITLVLLPDVAAWRWPPNKGGHYTENRLHGRNVTRNAFSRLWISAYALGLDLIEQDFNGERLNADALMNLVDRTGLNRYHRYVRCHTRLSMQHTPPPGRPREEDFRLLTKIAHRRLAFINPEVLNDDQLEKFVEEYVYGPDIKGAQTGTGSSAANDATQIDQAASDSDARTQNAEDQETPADALARIVADHGPMTARECSRRLGSDLEDATGDPAHTSEFGDALRTALAEQLVVELEDNLTSFESRTLYSPGTASVALRPLGDRSIVEMPLSELAEHLRVNGYSTTDPDGREAGVLESLLEAGEPEPGADDVLVRLRTYEWDRGDDSPD